MARKNSWNSNNISIIGEKLEKRFSIFELCLGINFFHFCLGRFEKVGERLGSPEAGVEIDTGLKRELIYTFWNKTEQINIFRVFTIFFRTAIAAIIGTHHLVFPWKFLFFIEKWRQITRIPGNRRHCKGHKMLNQANLLSTILTHILHTSYLINSWALSRKYVSKYL